MIDPKLPIHVWCRLLPQATIFLNIMQASRIHPSLSAYHKLMRAFDYDNTPFAPISIKVLIYETLCVRKSWATRGAAGWYIGPAMDHYR